MTQLRKPYQMYVLNLDTSRIFWLTALLILLVFISFFSGFLVGKVKSRSLESEVLLKNRSAMDQVINKINENENIKDEEYQFYELMSPKNSRENKPVVREEDKKEAEGEVQAKKEAETKESELKTLPEPKTKVKSVFKTQTVSDRYTIQVASYRGYHYARDLESILKSGSLPAYITKQNIKGILYYRVRVGPFTSRALALKVLSSVKSVKECANSYITSED